MGLDPHLTRCESSVKREGGIGVIGGEGRMNGVGKLERESEERGLVRYMLRKESERQRYRQVDKDRHRETEQGEV